MKLAYLMNTYPITSTTFVRREIEAHERDGVPVMRFAIRPWNQDLVDPADIAEADRVYYLLTGGVGRLVAAFLTAIVANPVGFVRAFRAMLQLMINAPNGRYKVFAYFLEAALLKRELIRNRIDHVHVHFSTNSAAVAMLSYLLGGPSYSFTVHGPDELLDMAGNSLSLKMKHAAFVVAITEYCRNVLEMYSEFQYSEKIQVVRCGVDLPSFDDPSQVPSNRDLVCVGRLCPQKAQCLLVEAVGRLKEDFPDLRLQLVGDGEDRPIIEERIADLGLEGMIDLVGWKSNPDVRKAISDSRALVLPSLAEGLPIVIMESFALGRPVLSTRITGIPELIDESCGWLAEPGSVDSLTEELEALLAADPNDLTKMGVAGRKLVEAYHDQDTNARTLRGLFERFTA